MQDKDKAMKDFESYPDVAADIINALIYEGSRIVKPENLLPAPTETLYERNHTLRNQYEDVEEYECLDGKINILYLIANQSTVDYKMLLRKAGYIGGVYREQYDGKLAEACPVMELVLYWGKKPWEKNRSIRQKFRSKQLTEQAWKYIDDIHLHVWELQHLSLEVRKRFRSDMRTVLDYLAEDNSCFRRKVVHKKAFINMIKALSGNEDLDGTDRFMEKHAIREEDEITMCDIFTQYEQKGREEGIKEGIKEGTELGCLKTVQSVMKKLNLTVEEALEAADIPKSEWSKYESRLDIQN